MRNLIRAIALASLLMPAASVAIYAADAPSPAAAADTRPVTLPKDIVWETDNDEPLIGSEKAIRGGRHNAAIGDYPLTFRLMGPNSNGTFAWWNRAFTMAFTLVGMHPVTDKFIRSWRPIGPCKTIKRPSTSSSIPTRGSPMASRSRRTTMSSPGR